MNPIKFSNTNSYISESLLKIFCHKRIVYFKDDEIAEIREQIFTRNITTQLPTVFSFNNVRIVNQTNNQIGLSTIFELRRKNKIGVAILETICSLVAIGIIIKITMHFIFHFTSFRSKSRKVF